LQFIIKVDYVIRAEYTTYNNKYGTKNFVVKFGNILWKYNFVET